MTVLLPDVVLDAAGLRRGIGIAVEGDTIAGEVPIDVDAIPPDAHHLPGMVLVPGFRNDHSHAFQRDLRGTAEGAAGDFWSWRDAMYGLAGRLDPDSIHDVSRRCFAEMLRAGYTSVAEFHYVHHQPDGTPHTDGNTMAKAVCSAAEDVGIRITLLLTAYERAGWQRQPEPAQWRFCDPTVDAYIARLDDLCAWADGRPLVDVGLAVHSVRAVSRPWLETIARAWRDRGGLPLHVHVDEQQREIDECIAEHGCRPIELLDRVGLLTGATTLVHATHASPDELDLAAQVGATICVCPTTEANLGDGWVPAQQLAEAAVDVTIGSDSNTIIDPLLELREIELTARRRAGARVVLPLPLLQTAGWRHDIKAGEPADLVAYDLTSDALAGVTDQHLAAALVFAGDKSAVTGTWVAGRQVHCR